MSNCSRNPLLRILFVFAFSPLLCGQAQVGNIIGRIQLTRGDFPSTPMLVELVLHNATVSSVYADDQGRFGFYSLDSNPYHVIIKDERYEPVDEQANLNLLNSAQVIVQIQLVPKSDGKKETLLDRTKGSNPYLVDTKEYNHHFSKSVLKEFNKGVEADHEGEQEDAIHHYEKVLASAPDYYPAHNNLGCDYLSKADFKSAEAQFEEAIRLNQNDAQAFLNLGNVLTLIGRYPEAEQALQDGVKRRPDSAFGQFLFGSLYSRTGRTSEAERSLREALQLDPKMSQAHLQLVNLYVQEKRISEAIGELRSYLKAFPDEPLAPKAREILQKLQAEAHAPTRP
jgi:tetratricopeptide (TPR) repeat protein